MKHLQFPDVNRLLAFCGWLTLASCGPPTWAGGIHAHLAWSHEGVRVVEVPANSPALRGDLRVDDRVLSVDGKPVAGLSGSAVHRLLSGEVGSTATLEVLRGADRLTLQILREPYATKGVGP
jgi:C-terminal processing protease CtpA/Prc